VIYCDETGSKRVRLVPGEGERIGSIDEAAGADYARCAAETNSAVSGCVGVRAGEPAARCASATTAYAYVGATAVAAAVGNEHARSRAAS
jgi:hypothetical protein